MYVILQWTVAAVVLNKINTRKRVIISFSPLWKLLMRSELRSFTYTDVCSVAVMRVLGGAAPWSCCSFREDFQSTNPASSRVFSLELAAPTSLRLLGLASHSTSAAAEFLNHLHNWMAHTPSSPDFKDTRGSFRARRAVVTLFFFHSQHLSCHQWTSYLWQLITNHIN